MLLIASAVCVWVVIELWMKGGVKDVRVGDWGTTVCGGGGGEWEWALCKG